MHNPLSEQSFVDVMLPEKVGRNEKLERIEAIVEWKRLAKLVNGIYASAVGRPSYPPMVMVKIMVLQQWYGASDEAIEEALWDRISFKRFVGLAVEDAVPDHSTISRFRKEVTERGTGPPPVQGVGAPVGQEGVVREAGDAAGRDDSGGASAETVAAGASGVAERDGP